MESSLGLTVDTKFVRKFLLVGALDQLDVANEHTESLLQLLNRAVGLAMPARRGETLISMSLDVLSAIQQLTHPSIGRKGGQDCASIRKARSRRKFCGTIVRNNGAGVISTPRTREGDALG